MGTVGDGVVTSFKVGSVGQVMVIGMISRIHCLATRCYIANRSTGWVAGWIVPVSGWLIVVEWIGTIEWNDVSISIWPVVANGVVGGVGVDG